MSTGEYISRFDKFTDRVLPVVRERIVGGHPEPIYSICTDEKGYVPTHDNKVAKAPTGKYEAALANGRSKRLFNDRTGGRHRGGFRMGHKAA